MKKAAKILGVAVLSLLGLAVLLYLIALAINWKDQSPSEDALAFQRLLDARPQVPDPENAHVYLLGFAAPRGQHPQDAGARRLAWIANSTWANREDTDPTGEQLEVSDLSSAQIAALAERCRDDRRACADAFRELAGKWQPDENESLVLQRYHGLLPYRAWRETVPLDPTAPLPPYSVVSHAQRLYMLELLQFAKEGDVQAVRAGLNADSLYWRNAMDQAQSLIGLLMASAYMRNHYFFGNLVLGSLPADKVAAAVPVDWEREFSAEERSLRLALASELAYNRRSFQEAMDESAWNSYDVEHTWFDVAVFRLSVPFLKPQATLNGTAADHALLCKQFDVPLDRYSQAEAVLLAAQREAPWFSIYNPTGAVLRKLSHPKTFAKYAYQAASTEGTRRAALLVAQLKAQGVPAGQVAPEVATAALRDPYTGSAFEWEADRRSLVFTGPEDHPSRRNEFFY